MNAWNHARVRALSALALCAVFAAPAAAADVSPPPGDVAQGREQFVRKCATCHPVDPGGRSNLGPNLYGVLGRVVGSYEGFHYGSPYLAAARAGEVWTPERAYAYLLDPTAMFKGGRMILRIKNETIRADLVAYLQSISPESREK